MKIDLTKSNSQVENKRCNNKLVLQEVEITVVVTIVYVQLLLEE